MRPILIALALLGASACRSAPSAPASAARAAAPAALAPASAPAARANRDLHGPPDLAKYVSSLASPARAADLQVPRTIELLRLAPEAVVADIGCGPGLFALPLGRACARGFVFAVDVEPAQLDALNERLAREPLPNVVPVLGTYTDPRLPPGRIDLALVVDTYHHIDARVEYFRRLRACFARGGRLAIVEYKPGSIPVGPPADHKLAAGVRERELAEAGYVFVERFEIHPWHDFELWRPAADASAAR